MGRREPGTERTRPEGRDEATRSELRRTVERLRAPVFFVGDNGAGSRIVRLHGGRVWAEGRPGAGATFYFTRGDGR